MKFAENINEIINVFNLNPLEGEKEMREYYCDNTMEFRTGDEYTSPIMDICEACQKPSEQNSFLLMGHRGCGKSTELNNMTVELQNLGYHVSHIRCAQDLDLNNIIYTDLLILLGEALIKIADEISLDLEPDLKQSLESFWNTEITETNTNINADAVSIEAGLEIKTPSLFSSLLKMFAKVKGDIKYSNDKRVEYKTKISQHTSEWMLMVNRVAVEITRKLDGKQPIIIFEDLDKLNAENAWDIFQYYSALLSGVSFPIIYTFPIALSYDPRFTAVEGYFIVKTLPMIKLETVSGEKYQPGINIIIDIIKKRAALELFDDDILEKAIEKTGGSLRDLFYVINTAAQRAIRRKSQTISMEDIQRALEESKTLLTRRIESKHYEFLASIYNGERKKISDKQMLLEMLQANTVLEYNGERWHNIHPLIADFLKEQKVIKNEQR